MWTCKVCKKEFQERSRLLHLRSKKCRKEYTDEEYMAFQEGSKNSRVTKNVVTKTKHRKKQKVVFDVENFIARFPDISEDIFDQQTTCKVD